MDRKKVLSKHEWWIDLLSFFVFVGSMILFSLFAVNFSPTSPIVFIVLGGLIVAYFFLHKKIKNFIIEKLLE